MDVVCTAGHVDHGKSTLVRALTGMEPDRFAEEQRRGLTIDLGFAWTQLSDGRRTRTVAFVDLPGHERFIGNMLAGAGPLRTALFTVAADEGWKPQSSEHLDILNLLEVDAGVIAITKVDAADPAKVTDTRTAIAHHVAGTSLETFEVVEVSAVDGGGLDVLRTALLDAVEVAAPRNDGPPRLWVDRAFTIKGAGTVVTGTLTGGALHTGDEVFVLPARQRVRVRGLQSLSKQVDTAEAGDRVAVNLSGVDRDAVNRGDVVAGLDVPPTTLLDVELRTLRSAEVGRRGAWHLHVGSGDWPATVRPLQAGPVVHRGFARLLLDRPAGIAAGDRFVLRDAGRRATVAGGVVLDAQPPPLRGAAQRGARGAQLEARRTAVVAGDRAALLALHVQERAAVPAAAAAAAVGLAPSEGQVAGQQAGLVALGGAWADPSSVGRWAAAAGGALRGYHDRHPDERSAPRDLAAQAAVGAGCPRAAAADLLALLIRAGRVVAEGTGVRLPDHGVRLTAQQEEARAALLAALDRNPFAPPRIAEAAVSVGAAPALLKEMEAAGDIVRLDQDLAMTAAAVAQAAQLLRQRYDAEGPLTAAQAKEALGTSRKFALPLLEELDRRGITRREGDIRHIP